MQAHQTLLDYYRASNDNAKVKAIILKMVELKPEDGKFRFSLAQQLMQINEGAAAVEQYKVAIKLDPAFFSYQYWENAQLFRQQGKG